MYMYNAHRKPQMGTMQPARHKRDMHCRSLAPDPLPRSCTASRDPCDPGRPHGELLQPIQPMPRPACAGMLMPALPTMGADGTGQLLDLTSDHTACCCTFPLLRSPSSVERLPSSTLFLVSMVAKSSLPASSFKRGHAADPSCLHQPRGSSPRPTHLGCLLAPMGALEQRAAKSLVCAACECAHDAPIRLSSMARSTLL